MRNTYPSFAEPPQEYRSTVFWAWNDKLDPEELSRQIRLFQEAHIGGFFMHSRDGLETPYMGEEWDACIRHSVREAEKTGLKAWLYDEDRWPSGSCGGRVPAWEDGRFALKGLTLEVCHPENAREIDRTSLKAAYAARVEGHDATACRRLSLENPFSLHEEELLLAIRFEQSKGSDWFNGSAPPDNLNPETVRNFLQSTHEHYASYLERDFGRTVPGIFTDEPSLADRHAAFHPERGWIPWSSGMDDFYRDLGYGDIYENLPYLYFKGQHSSKVRFRYWHCLALRFEQSYSQQIGQWCRQHKLQFSGHYLQEDKLGLSTRVNGSIMPHYTHADLPGVDILCERTDEYLTLKQCSSVVHQYGKSGMIAETYAAAGWDFTFEGMKWIGDWEYALGVTQRCLHLSLYSLRGERKHDYPPSFHYQNPLWPLFPKMEDYFARLSFLLQQGEVVRNALFIHPAGSVWTRMGCSPYGNPVRREERDVPALDQIGFQLNEVLRFLSLRGRDTDLADETLLARDGSVEGARLRLKKAVYSVVILAHLTDLYPSTFDLLRTFHNQGGQIILLGDPPSRLAGKAERDLPRFFGGPSFIPVKTEGELLEALNRIDPPLFFLKTLDGEICSSCVTQIRQDGSRFILFLANNERERPLDVWLTLNRRGALYQGDFLSGLFRELSPDAADTDSLTIRCRFEPCGSKLFIIETVEDPAGQTPGNGKALEPFKMMIPDTGIPVHLDKPNVLVLDYTRYSLGGQYQIQEEGFIWHAEESIRQRLSMRKTAGGEVVQRYVWVGTAHPSDGTPLRLSYNFPVETVPAETCFLCMDDAASFTVTLNGIPVDEPAMPSPLSHDLKMYPLKGFKGGDNVLELSCLFRETMTLDALYLLGNFGVSPARVITEPVQTLSWGDWTGQGLFHYPGSVSYRFEAVLPPVQRSVILSLGRWEGSCLRIACNGVSFDKLWKGDTEVDISEAVQPGRNEISLILFGSLRNMFGPLHLKSEEDLFISPGSFSPPLKDLSAEYRVKPYGLFDSPTMGIKIPREEPHSVGQSRPDSSQTGHEGFRDQMSPSPDQKG